MFFRVCVWVVTMSSQVCQWQECCVCLSDVFGFIFIIDIVGTFAQVRSMIAESFVPSSYTPELWQFSHGPKDAFRHAPVTL